MVSWYQTFQYSHQIKREKYDRKAMSRQWVDCPGVHHATVCWYNSSSAQYNHYHLFNVVHYNFTMVITSKLFKSKLYIVGVVCLKESNRQQYLLQTNSSNMLTIHLKLEGYKLQQFSYYYFDFLKPRTPKLWPKTAETTDIDTHKRGQIWFQYRYRRHYHICLD